MLLLYFDSLDLFCARHIQVVFLATRSFSHPQYRVRPDRSSPRVRGVPGQAAESKICKCNCGGVGYQTSMLGYVFPGWG